MTTGSYDPGAEVPIRGTFRDANGELADPSAVTVTVKGPHNGGVPEAFTFLAGQVTKVSTGIYQRLFAVTTPGRYFAHWDGDGDVESADQVEFYVQPNLSTGNAP